MASVHVETSLVISSQRDRVWAVLTDFELAPRWIKNTLLRLEGPLCEGAELYFSFPKHPRFPGRLTRLQPPEVFGLSFATRDFLFTLREVDGHTEVRCSMETPHYARYTLENLERGNQKICQAMLRHLKSLVEETV